MGYSRNIHKHTALKENYIITIRPHFVNILRSHMSLLFHKHHSDVDASISQRELTGYRSAQRVVRRGVPGGRGEQWGSGRGGGGGRELYLVRLQCSL